MSTLEQAIERARRRRRLPPPAVRKELREACGLSQADLAAAMVPPVSRETVCRYESGARTPRGAHLDAYVALLDRLTRELSA